MNDQTSNSNHLAIPLAYIAVFALALLIPLRIIGYGYLPPDDALRHAAKAVSGKDWPQIMLMRPDITMDCHMGWHALLSAAHRVLGLDVDGLVVLSVAGLMFLFLVAPIFLLRRPEAWVLTLIALCIFNDQLPFRLSLGRPYLLSMMTNAIIFLSWERLKEPKAKWGTMGALALITAITTWLHSTCWYLFSLPLACLFFAREWRAGFRLAMCLGVGVLLGASFSGHPIDYLAQSLRITTICLDKDALARMLVSELQPMGGDVLSIVLIALFLAWRKATGNFKLKDLDTPVFIMIVLCWTLGLSVRRFWVDWGMPALLVWMVLAVQAFLETKLPAASWRRLGLTVAAGLPLFLLFTVDTNSRWTYNLSTDYLDQKKPEHAAWLPEPGGLLYSDSMTAFYQTFYANPHGNWRYVLGFESGFMTEENRTILRSIQRNFSANQAFAPWVKKMRPQDRLLILSQTKPEIPGLEWNYTSTGHWLGRLPRAKAGESTATTATQSAAKKQ